MGGGGQPDVASGDGAAAAAAAPAAASLPGGTAAGGGGAQQLKLVLLRERCIEANRGIAATIPLEGLPLSLGRNPQSVDNGGVVVLAGGGISRQHLCLRPLPPHEQGNGPGVMVVDESSQGVAINQVRIPAGQAILAKVGDILALGLPQAQTVAVGQPSGSNLAGATYRLELVDAPPPPPIQAPSTPAPAAAAAAAPAAPEQQPQQEAAAAAPAPGGGASGVPATEGPEQPAPDGGRSNPAATSDSVPTVPAPASAAPTAAAPAAAAPATAPAASSGAGSVATGTPSQQQETAAVDLEIGDDDDDDDDAAAAAEGAAGGGGGGSSGGSASSSSSSNSNSSSGGSSQASSPSSSGRRRHSLSSDEVEILDVTPAPQPPKRPRREPEVVILLDDDDDDDDDDDVTPIAAAGKGKGGGGGGWGGVGAAAAVAAAAAAAAKPAAKPAAESRLRNRMLKALECAVCMEVAAAACHLNCGHIACFTCIHRRFVLASVEDGSIHGFRERKRLCPTCRTNIQHMSRDVKIDELVEQALEEGEEIMSADDRADWEGRKRDGLALATYYMTRLRGNPQALAMQPRELLLKVNVKVCEASGGRGSAAAGAANQTMCQHCALPILPGEYEVAWAMPSGTAAVGVRAQPAAATTHLACLRLSACAAIRKGLRAEDLLSLGYKFEVASLLSNEPGGVEGFKLRCRNLLSEERVPYPWWVSGTIRINTSKKKTGFRAVVPPGGASGGASGGAAASAASASGSAAVAAAAQVVVAASSPVASGASARPRRSPRQQAPGAPPLVDLE